jgi:hypothetical protein
MNFGMNTLTNSVAALALCAVVVPSVRAAEPATRYVVIFEKNYAHEEKYSVMNMDDYRKAARKADVAKAMEMFEAQLDLVRLGGDIPDGGGNGSVNRLGDPIKSLVGAPSGDGSRQGKRLGGPITSLGGSPFGDGSSR